MGKRSEAGEAGKEDGKRYLGGRKLYHVLQAFLDEHRMEIGRDAFFDLLREYSLLIRKAGAKAADDAIL
jgi:hypothetical protein